ncbi:restriction endonuclease subunit S [Micrococcus luteus]|uniref:restriction endonuclease subunit S n=1 Tax=Micrococcus TaxID=1269 RepID=UPI0009B80C37|nr:restriction endonuclease subunit S [Micrococcus luteus]MCV7530057.1 restriction endonuclease subunit S [Micrococcus luteus]
MKTVKLGEVAEVVSGATPKTGVADYWGGKHFWITPAELSRSSSPFISETERTLTEAGLRSCAARMLPPGSVLLSSRAPIGLTGITTVPMATNQGFKSLVPGPDLSAHYVFHWLRGHRALLESMGTGATFKELSKRAVESIKIPLPDLRYQEQVAEILDRADGQRSRRRAQVDSLDVLVRSRFAEVVAQAPAGPVLGDVAAFVRGVTFKPADVSDEGVPVMRTKNVQRHLDLSDVIRIPADLIKNEGKYLRSGDTLVSSANSYNLVGKCCFVGELPERSAIGGFVAALRPGPGVDPVFLHHWFNSDRIQETVRSFGNQTTNISNLNIKRTLTLRLPDVPLAVQREFAAVVAKIDAQRERIERALVLEDELFASLQYRAFRGEL